jgi:hypothetical protein
VAGSGLVAAAGLFVTAAVDPGSLELAGPLVVPPVPWLAVVTVLVALLPAVVAPRPPQARHAHVPSSEPEKQEVAA